MTFSIVLEIKESYLFFVLFYLASVRSLEK